MNIWYGRDGRGPEMDIGGALWIPVITHLVCDTNLQETIRA